MKPVYLSDLRAEAIHTALVKAGETDLAAEVARLGTRTPEQEAYIGVVQNLDREDGLIDVDDCPCVSESDEGAYVLIWRWVRKDDAKCLGSTESSP